MVFNCSLEKLCSCSEDNGYMMFVSSGQEMLALAKSRNTGNHASPPLPNAFPKMVFPQKGVSSNPSSKLERSVPESKSDVVAVVCRSPKK